MSDIPKVMSGVVLTGHGGPEKLELRDDIPVPQLSPSDVLVRVEAAGVNNTDINTRKAWYSKGDEDASDASWSGSPVAFPLIQGADVCGRIVAVGDSIEKDRIGDRVLIEPALREANGVTLEVPLYLGSDCAGGFAQFVAVASRHAYKVESNLDSAELASFPCSYATAENMLTRAKVCDQDRVLITGASGGVGSAAVQLAKARGAHVIAVTSKSKVTRVSELGANETFERDEDLLTRLGHNSVDVVIDLVAGPAWPSLLKLLRPKGRYAVAGAIAGPVVELDVRTLYLKDLSFFGCTIFDPEIFGNLVRLIEQERIAPLVACTYPLSRISDAQAFFESNDYVGKIVLEVAGPN